MWVRLILLALSALTIGWSQQTTATLTGTVTDTSGSTVPGAEIKVVAKGTNAAREAVSDASGNYTLPFLQSGEYTISVSSKGFQGQRISGLTLQVGQTARQDFQLKVGDVTESISVAASGAILQTDNAVVGTVIDSAKVVQLPLNGRNFVQLAQLIPGVQAGTPGSITVRRGRGSIGQTSSAYGETAMSANGSRDTANRFFLDGIEIMDYDAMTYSFAVSVDALSEFKVETSSYGAEAGGAPGGHVNIITKRGSNGLHGTAWEFNRNNALTQSYDAIGNKSVTPPRLNRNQFGANIGGPVFIPKVYNGKDKTFFFFNWEEGRLLQSTTPGLRIVPTTAYRSGDFSRLTNARTGEAIVLRDPLGVGPFTNNQIPASLLSPQSRAFLPFTPNPNTSQGAFNFISNTPSSLSTQRNYTVRGDHNFSSKDSIYLRYVFNDTNEAGVPFWGNDQRDNLGSARSWAGGWLHTFGPSLVNDFKGGTHAFAEFENFGTSNKPEFDIVGKMGLPLVSRRPFEYGPPSVSVSGNDGGFSFFDLQRQIGPRQRSNSITQFADTLSYQRGKHFIKVGADIAIRDVTFDQARAPRGSFGFDGTYTGAAMADFMLGYVRTASINPTPTATRLRNWWQGYFINDDWKATARLTLNFGLRYDYFGKYTQADDKFVNIDQNGLVITNLIRPDGPYGRALMKPDKNNWGPRFGFAYRPAFADDAVIRGGYGIYYTPQISNAIFAMAEGAQATSGAALIGNITGAPNIFFNNPFALAQTSGALNFAVSNDPNMRDSYVQQWNLNLQKKIIGGIVIDAGYVGSKGTRLIVTFGDMNRPIDVVDPRTPGLASLNARRPNQQFQRNVTGDKSIGNSIYHAFQMKAERRMAKGITFLTAYTWSHAISGPSDIGGQIGGGSFIGAPQNIYNLANERSTSGFDLRHRFVNTILYDIPLFKNAKGVTGFLLGGWQTSTIMTFQGGFGAPVSANVDTTGTGINSRPDVLPGQNGNLDGGQRTWAKWINTSAFAVAPFGRFGTSPRTDAVRLPGITNFDFSVNKQFRFKEDKRFEFRLETFNLFNNYNPDPGSLDLNVRSATFGAIGGGVQGITTRVMQLGGKFYF